MNTLFLALRISTSEHGKKSSPAIKVAIAAVALSVAVMLAAIAIVLGFKEEITRKVLGFTPHVTVHANPAYSGGEYLTVLTPALDSLLESSPYISSYSLSASVPAILKPPGDFKGIYLRSLADGVSADFVSSQLEEGSLPDLSAESHKIVISRKAADELRLAAGDIVPTYFFINDKIKVERLEIAGIYNSHFSLFDDLNAFSSLSFLQKVGEIDANVGTQLNIYVKDFNEVTDDAAFLRKSLEDAFVRGDVDRYYEVDTALSSGASYFSWLSLLDTNVVVILVLMTAVALITLISGMLILIVDKKRLIGILKALGATNGMIGRVFIWLTVRVALTGLIIGNALMLSLLFLQEKYHFIPLDPDSYYIDFVPVKLTLASILILNGAILLITYLTLLLPSRMVRSIRVSLSE